MLLREQRRRACRTSLETWCIDALAPLGQSPARHHKFLIRKLEAVARGDIDRLMVFMPPGSAKSTYASVLFPAWFFAQAPNKAVIGASHGAELAEDFSGAVIRRIKEHSGVLGYGLINENVKLWRTSNGGVYRAAGAGGSITGRRADLFIIDDPIKGRKDAESDGLREDVWRWYQAEVVTRLKPGARIILIQTRWHEADLGGRLLEAMKAGGDQWSVIDLPAICDSEDDPLGRAIGEPLWPEWENVEALERKRAAVGEREWSALYQQNPRPGEGALFKVAEIAILDAGIPCVNTVRAWDLAATEQVGTRDPDWTTGVKMGRTGDGRYVVLDVIRLRGGPDEVERAIVNTAAFDGRKVKIRLPQDPGQAGKSQALYLTRALSGYTITSERETGDKATRASPFASQVNVGNVAMVKAPWNAAFRDELSAFPAGAHDDQVDACSGAFEIVGLKPPPIRVSSEAIARFGGRRL